MIDLRLGKYQDVLQDVECDAVICDPRWWSHNLDRRRNTRQKGCWG